MKTRNSKKWDCFSCGDGNLHSADRRASWSSYDTIFIDAVLKSYRKKKKGGFEKNWPMRGQAKRSRAHSGVLFSKQPSLIFTCATLNEQVWVRPAAITYLAQRIKKKCMMACRRRRDRKRRDTGTSQVG